jgi:four helix bundle protein
VHYRDLTAWQRGMDLVEAVYRITRAWPADERFSLVDQVRRAAISVPANIAEGQGRAGTREFLHHLSIARGSLCEIETHLLIGQGLGYGGIKANDSAIELAAEVGRLLNGLARRLREKANATDHRSLTTDH